MYFSGLLSNLRIGYSKVSNSGGQIQREGPKFLSILINGSLNKRKGPKSSIFCVSMPSFSLELELEFSLEKNYKTIVLKYIAVYWKMKL